MTRTSYASLCHRGRSQQSKEARIDPSHLLSRSICFAPIFIFASFLGSCTTYDSVGQPAGQPEDAYTLILTIVDGVELCNDVWSKPDYYATALRRDPLIEKELAAIRLEREQLSDKIRGINAIVKPLEQRRHNIKPLSIKLQSELASLREKANALTQAYEQHGTDQSSDTKRELEVELDEISDAIKRMEQRSPLNREEILLLNKKRLELAPLVQRRSGLDSRQDELLPLVVMRTPNSLRVYPNDSLRLRLMEQDVRSNDICATWELVLDEKIINLGGKSLFKSGNQILRLSVEPAHL